MPICRLFDLKGEGYLTGDDEDNDDEVDRIGEDHGLEGLTELCMTCLLIPCVCILTKLTGRLEEIRNAKKEEEEVVQMEMEHNRKEDRVNINKCSYRKHQEHGGDWKEDFERQEEQIARKEEHILQEDKEAEDQQEDQ